MGDIDRTAVKRTADSPGDEVEAKRAKDNDGKMHQMLNINMQWFDPVDQHYKWSPWVAALKSITKDEFEMVVNDGDKFVNIKQPLKQDVKPGWEAVRDLLLGKSTRRFSTIEQTPVKAAASPQTDKSPALAKDAIEIKSHTPPRLAVRQVQKLLQQWTSPK